MSPIARSGAFAGVFLLSACAWIEPKSGPLRESDTAGDDDTDGGVTDGGVADANDGAVLFGRDLRPIMNRTADDPAGPGCRDCHYNTSSDPQGIYAVGLDMTTLGSLRKGGETTGTKIVIPGDPAGSYIIQKLKGTYPIGVRMPKSGPPYLTDAEIQMFSDWIAQGAVGEDSE